MNVQQITDLNTRIEIAGKQAMQRLISEGGWPALAASSLMSTATLLLESLIKWDAQGRTFEVWKEDFVVHNLNKDLFDIPELAAFTDEIEQMVNEGDLKGYYDEIVVPSTVDLTGEQLTAQLEYHRRCLAEMAEEPCIIH